jgi:hypothetical protein
MVAGPEEGSTEAVLYLKLNVWGRKNMGVSLGYIGHWRVAVRSLSLRCDFSRHGQMDMPRSPETINRLPVGQFEKKTVCQKFLSRAIMLVI